MPHFDFPLLFISIFTLYLLTQQEFVICMAKKIYRSLLFPRLHKKEILQLLTTVFLAHVQYVQYTARLTKKNCENFICFGYSTTLLYNLPYFVKLNTDQYFTFQDGLKQGRVLDLTNKVQIVHLCLGLFLQQPIPTMNPEFPRILILSFGIGRLKCVHGKKKCHSFRCIFFSFSGYTEELKVS